MTEPEAVLAAIPDPKRQGEARELHAIFRRVTGWEALIWGKGLIGYGRYLYHYASGRGGEFCATGFAVSVRRFSIHIMPGYNEFPEIAGRLGKFKRGKSCWYINKLADIDQDALADLIRAGLSDLRKFWPLTPT